MPSITYWNRVEPRPRHEDITRALKAEVRDPLWMLTRQLQFGEFRGEDAGSPAWAEITTTTVPLTGWRPEGGTLQPLSPSKPIEAAVEDEPLTLTLALRVELGQLFERMLAAAGLETFIAAFRTAYSIAPPSAVDSAKGDVAAERYRRVMAGRAIDGGALLSDARAARPNVPAAVTLPDHVAEVAASLGEFVDAVDAAYPRAFGAADPASWKPARLEYRLEVVAATPSGGAQVYTADPDRDGEIDWSTLDGDRIEQANGNDITPVTRTTIPAPVRFRGMPNARWWDFENAAVDFGSVPADRRDVAKLIFLDFMLVHGNDWFVLPIEQDVGTAMRIDALLVRDVFGGFTIVDRASSGSGTERWSLFEPQARGPREAADYFVLPPSGGSAIQSTEPIEDVRFLRDEMANMAWAIELTTEGDLGVPLSGRERAARIADAVPPATPPPPLDPPAALVYDIQSSVPENWLPLVPAVLDADGQVALELGAMLRDNLEEILPIGRILNPPLAGGEQYRIAEEEVPRSGLRVTREVCRARGTDGSTHLWIARRKRAGRGEGSSGLRFDSAEPPR